MAEALTWLHEEPLADVIYRSLRDAICDEQYGPRTRLVQDQLAEEMGVSRTPVREALLRLAQDGYAVRVHGRGYLVRELSATEVADVYQVRRQLEPLAVRLAFDRYSARDRAEFRQLASGTTGERRGEGRYFETNRAFHLALVAPCPNSVLVKAIADLWDLPVNRMISQRFVAQRRDADAWRDEHFAIVDAIDRDDRETAVRMVEEHLDAEGLRTQPPGPQTREPAREAVADLPHPARS